MSPASRASSFFAVILRAQVILRNSTTAFFAMCVLATSVSYGANDVDGKWSSLENWPLIAIHAAITPDGRVLSYGTKGNGQQTGFFIYDVWDPQFTLSGGHITLNNFTGTDLFCSSQVILPQSGEILITGGDNWTGTGTTNTGNNNSNLFDYGDDSLTSSSGMFRPRWYSSATALVNGEVYIQGGNGGADFPEVREINGGFRLLTGVPTGAYATVFPRNFQAPDGRLFGYDTAGRMYYVDTSGAGSIVSAGQFSSSYGGWQSGAAMYQPGKILQIGANSNGVIKIDITGPTPVVTTTQSIAFQRRWVSATVLADGKVLATGGSVSANDLPGINTADIWDPNTGTWHVGSAGAVARLYHSSALLLPDATVLVAGGGAPGPLNNTNAEIYSPPYLYNNNSLATRPQILSAPDIADVGDNLAVQINSSVISRVTLVKTGSVTHSVNMDQRFVELPFNASGNMLDVSLPPLATNTPPGFYMMFVINNAGVPSTAHMLRVNIDPNSSANVDFTPTIGGAGGNAFQLACNVDEILVGVHGKYATYVNQIGPQCVKMNQFGQWIGSPVNRAVTGTTSSGTSFSKTCPTNYAVSGFKGRAGQYVDQLDMQCRALTPTGDLTGPVQYLGSSGGSGGSAQGPYSCGTGNPVYALYGRSDFRIDNIGVQCRQGVITPISTNSNPVVANPGPQSGTVGLPVNLQINASDGDGDPLIFSATGLPPGLTIKATNPNAGLITGSPTLNGVYNVQVTVTDGVTPASANFVWTVDAAPPLAVVPMPAQPPRQVGTPITYTATASGGVNVVYQWDFADGDGLEPVSPTSSPTRTHTFNTPGIYYIELIVNDALGIPATQMFAQRIHLPLTASAPSSSSNIVYEANSTLGQSPTITNPGRQTSDLNDSVGLGIVVTDPEGDTLIFSATGLPPGLVIGSTSGAVSGTVTAVGSYDVTISADDGKGGIDTASFNWLVCDPGQACESLDFNTYVTISYTNQDNDGNVAVADGGATLVLSNNTWRRTAQTFEITPTSVLEFDFRAPVQGEIHGIGFDNLNDITPNRTFKLYGTQGVSWDIAAFENYPGGNAVVHYSIPVGQYYTGSAMNLIMINDHDNGTGSSSRFSNVQINGVGGGGSNESPTITNPGNQTTDVNAGVNVAVVANDPESNPLTYSAAGLPNGLTISSGTGTITGVVTSVGTFDVTIMANDGNGGSDTASFRWSVCNVGGACGNTGNSRVWAVNMDNDSVTVFDAVTQAKLAEIPVGTAPRSVAIAPDHRAWVTNKTSGDISVIDADSFTVVQTIPMPYGSQPYGLVFSPVLNEAYVTLQASGKLLKLDALSGAQLDSLDTGPHVRGVAIDGTGNTIYVSRFITPRQSGEETKTINPLVGGGELLVVDRSPFGINKTILLQHSTDADAENQGRGVPNYLGAMAISPDGTSGRVPSKKDNILRGIFRDPPFNLNFQNTVRAISSSIDLTTNTEDFANRIDYDNSSLSSAAVFDPFGMYGFVAMETSQEVAVVDAHADTEIFRVKVGRAPQGVAISPDGLRLYVNNFMDRTVDVLNLESLQTAGQWSADPFGTLPKVDVEKLTPQVLLGKQLFYDAFDTRLAFDRYLSCAVCHNDGAGDGRVWDLTGLGEGLRNTINLTGHDESHGPRHWTANFDEVQDFEGQIRNLSAGTGLMDDGDFFSGTVSQPLGQPKAGISPDLDALAAYVNSTDEFPLSPHRNNDGSMTAEAIAGREVFKSENCASCHSGTEFTDSSTNTLHDIGTIKLSSGKRLGQTLTGFDTPTLRGIWASKPYLHDGSAVTIAGAILAHNFVALGEPELSQLVAYLEQIDINEVSAPLPNLPPDVTNPGNQADQLGNVINLPIIASDSDGGTLSFSAIGLPASLTIDPASGVIGGTLTVAGNSAVTLTVSDGTDDTTISFSWDVNTLPGVTNPGPQADPPGIGVNLQIIAIDADGDTLSYSATGLPNGLTINSISGLISGTPTTEDTYAVIVTVFDGTDSTSVSFGWNISLTPNVPPNVTNPGAQSGRTGFPVNLQIVATDAEGDTLSYSASGLPLGLTINTGSGLISGSPSAGSYNVTVTVSDGTNNVPVSFSWEINTPPDVTNPGAQSDAGGSGVNLQIIATDADGDTLSYSASGLPVGLTINTGTGLISGSPSVGNYNVIVTVSDGTDSVPVSFGWTITAAANVPPNVTNPGAQLNGTGDNVNLAIVATDANGDPLTYSAIGLPTGLTIDAVSGVISGNPINVGNWVVTVTVDDGAGGQNFATFNWTINCGDCIDFNTFTTTSYGGQDISQNVTVEDNGATLLLSNNTWRWSTQTFNIEPNTILEFDFRSTSEGEIHATGFDTTNSPPNGTGFKLYGTQNVAYILDFKNYPGGGVVVHYVIPVGLYYTGNNMKLIFINDQDSGSGSNSRYSNVRIYGGNSNQSPTITNPGNQVSEQNTVINLPVSATDPDGDQLTFSATNLPTGLSLNSATGNITGSVTTLGSFDVTITVVDGNGGSDSESFTWLVCEPGGSCDTLDFNTYVTIPYANQDRDGNVSVVDAGATIVLSNNTWRRTAQTFNITPTTVLEFDFESPVQGEIQGIGFDDLNGITPNRTFKLYGTQGVSWDIPDFENYSGGVVHYVIPVGQYYTGSAMNLIMINDHDNGSGSSSRFSNVRIID